MKMLLFLFLLISGACTTFYKGKKNKHFNGKYFQNTTPHKKTLWQVMQLAFGGPNYDWPKSVKVTPMKDFPERVYQNIKYTFIGHSTLLVQMNGINILTDPVYSERVSPVTFAGPKRVRIPAVKFEDLPHIDVVLISHDHYDHLDIDTLKKLVEKQKSNPPLVIAGVGNEELLEDEDINPYLVLDWDKSTQYKDLKITFVECQHRSGRNMFGQNRTLWGSFVIESPEARVYFAGDTGYSNHFKNQGKRYKKFDLSFIPIGAYTPRWFMKDVHVNPTESVLAHQDLHSQLSVGIHFGTFKLTYEKIDDPIKDLANAMKLAGIPEHKFLVPKFGETKEVIIP